MASSSSSAPPYPQSGMYDGKWEHDVFVCYRGADTADGFTSHLREALSREKIKVFIDKMLKKTESIDELIPILEKSALSIVVFSKNFADSSWCLNEVATIHKRMKDARHRVLPVFYKMDPSDVSEDSRSYAKTIERDFGATPPEVRKSWMVALEFVANKAGYTSEEYKIDSELVKAVVNFVLKMLPEMSPRVQSDNLIAMDARVDEVEQLLAMNTNDFRFVELWGMGGVGKTTLAEACYRRLMSFEKGIKYQFVRNINQRHEKETGMEGIVRELYSALLSESNISYDDLYAGNIRSRLSQMMVFLVFDDVGTLSQLEQLLLGDLSSCSNLFAPGSRIIVTTRSRMMLPYIGATILQVGCLDFDESLQLFAINAFGKRLLPDDDDVNWLELSSQALSYCQGLPLAIKVVGRTLSGKSRDYWESFLGNMEKFPPSGIIDVLKSSYKALENDAEKGLFLDIACFFSNGYLKDILIKYCPAPHMLQDLIDKSLCTFVADEFYEKIEVHDLLREMAWSIVNEESKLENRTRVKNYDDVHKLLTRSSSFAGGRATEGIYLNLSIANEMHLEANAFEGMASLRYLIFFYPGNEYEAIKVHVPSSGLDMLPDSLMWLFWDGFPSESLPSRFSTDNLVVLCLRGSPILKRCWEGAQPKLPNLVQLNLTHCINLVAIPDLSGSPNLEYLTLEGCKSLIELSSHVGDLEKLVELDLDGCTNLRRLPPKLNSKFLTGVHMSNCPKFTRCPEISSGELKILDLMETPVEAPLPSAIYDVKSGGALRLCGKHITSFPAISTSLDLFRLCHTTIREMDCYDDDNQQCSLPRFVRLALVDNPQLKSLSRNIWKMVSHTLVLEDCPSIETLPEISQPVMGLTQLSITECGKLKSFPSGIENLQSLQDLFFVGTYIKSVPSCIQELDNLSSLYLASNKSLEFIPNSIHKLAKLSHLSLTDCSKIQSLPELPPNLQTLDLSGCTSLSNIHAVSNLHPQPKLVILVALNLTHCINLDAIPDLSGSPNLEYLTLKGCKSLIELPSHVGDLEKLVKLDLDDCTNLRSLPPKLNSKFLTHVHMSNCPKLTRCPEINSGELKILDLMETPVEAPLPSAIYDVKSGGILRLCGKHITSFPAISASLDFFRLCHTTIREMDCYDDDNQQCSLPRFVRLELVDNPQLKSFSRNIWKMVSHTLVLKDCLSIETLPEISQLVTGLTQLSITGCGKLKSFPSGIENLKSLQELWFTSTDIKVVPSCIQELDQLSILNLGSNKSLEFIPNSIHKLAKLSHLSLTDCSKIQSLPELPPNLQTLDLSGCTSLSNIHAVSNLHPQPKLVRLNLSNCINLVAIPDLSGSPNLKYLTLQGCKSLIELPSYVGDLDKLVELDLKGCTNLRSLPPKLNSKFLTHVHMSNCPKLTRCPEISSGELKVLDLMETPVEAPLPSAIYDVKSGGSLRLCGKHITSFPAISASLDLFLLCHTTIRDMDCYDDDQQGSLPRFVRLALVDNPQLKSFSRNIWKMVSHTLVLEDCPSIETLPEISQPVMGLTKLSIRECGKLESFPSGIENLKLLQELYFTGTDIKVVPSCIQELGNLSSLYLASNKSLEFIPNSIHKLAKLSHLSLTDCSKIQSLPELPPNLQTLDLSGCTSLSNIHAVSNLHPQPKLVILVALNLTHCINLDAIPDLSGSPNLEYLTLKGCKSLIELPSHVGDLEKLVKLDLDDCTNLRSLPPKLNSKFLTHVHMSNCPKLTRCPEINSGELKILDLMETPVEAPLPSAIYDVKSGGILRLCGKHITSFPAISASLDFFRLCHTTIREMDCYDDDNQQCSLPRFVRLELVDNPQLKSFSRNIWKMVSHTLVLKDCLSIETLPEISQLVTGLTQLSITGCGKLKSFPSGIENLKSLQELWFTSTDIKVVPSCIQELDQLSILNLGSNKSLEFIPNSIHKLAKLSHLSLTDCSKIQSLPELPPNLQTLDLSGCTSLSNIHAVSNLHPQPKLVRLNLSNCINLVAIPDLSGSPNLKYLTLQGCKSLIELPSYVGDLDKLVELDLKGCTNLRSLPPKLNSKFLTHVHMSNCPKLTRCPEISSGELKVLDLMETPVEAPLPSAIYDVKSGGSLRLCGKHITSFPAISASLDLFLLCHTTIRDMDCYDDDQQGSLPRFVRLALVDNPQLKSFSRNIWKMVSHTLVLEDCPSIETLPEISQPVMGLTKLSIRECGKLESFPSGIENLKLLQELYFTGTDIKVVPSCIQELGNLSSLYLASNKSLEFIPNSIHKLAKLSYLSFSCCSRIQSLPELPPNLQTLEVSVCTSLKALPSNIGRLRWESLYFEDCPELDTNLPQEIVLNFPSHAASNLHPQGVLQYSGSKIPGWFDYKCVNYENDSYLVVQLPPPNCTIKRLIKGITFSIVCSSDIGEVFVSATCDCSIGSIVAASWSSRGFGLRRTKSDNVYIWYDKNLLGETKEGQIPEEAEPWYERYAAGLTVSFRFSLQPYKAEDAEKLKSIKIKRVGVSLLY